MYPQSSWISSLEWARSTCRWVPHMLNTFLAGKNSVDHPECTGAHNALARRFGGRWGLQWAPQVTFSQKPLTWDDKQARLKHRKSVSSLGHQRFQAYLKTQLFFRRGFSAWVRAKLVLRYDRCTQTLPLILAFWHTHNIREMSQWSANIISRSSFKKSPWERSDLLTSHGTLVCLRQHFQAQLSKSVSIIIPLPKQKRTTCEIHLM